MMANYLPTPDMENAPPIIRQLRAVFDDRLEHDLFTQLVARPLADRENARPSFTISLFLVTR